MRKSTQVSKSEADKAKPRELVCIGMRTTNDGNLSQGWLDGSTERFWGAPIARNAGPGAIFLRHFVKDADGGASVLVKGERAPTFVRGHGDQRRVAGWCIEDRAAKWRHERDKAAARFMKDDPIKAALLPVRKIMARYSNSLTREAILWSIVAELRRPLNVEEDS